MFTPGHAEPGGAAARSRLLAAGFRKRGWDVRVVTRAGTLHAFRLSKSDGLAVLEIPGFGRRRLGGLLFLVCAVPAGLVWGRRASAFLAIQLVSPSTAAAICSLAWRRPYLALSTTGGSVSELHDVLESRVSRIRLRLLHRARCLVAQTDEGAATLARLVGHSSVAVVPNPVRDVLSPELTGEPHVLYAGRFSAEKDLGRLVEAWRAVIDEVPGATLTLAGAGGRYRSVEGELRRRVEGNDRLRKTVRFTGWVADVAGLFRTSDVYVLPSVSEGMSNALLEACAWGRVVVASDIQANRAVLGDDYPLLFSTGNTTALIEALRRALGDDALRENARIWVLERVKAYSVYGVVGRLEELIARADRARY